MTRLLQILPGLLLAFAAPVGADDADGVTDFGKAVFSEVERKLIRDYYRDRFGSLDGHHDHRDRDDADSGKKQEKHKQHKTGKGNPKGLPPGIAMKLERGGTLPPGIAKKHLPDDLERRLPPVRTGYERAEIDGEVVLVHLASQKIVDVLRDSASRAGKALFDDD